MVLFLLFRFAAPLHLQQKNDTRLAAAPVTSCAALCWLCVVRAVSVVAVPIALIVRDPGACAGTSYGGGVAVIVPYAMVGDGVRIKEKVIAATPGRHDPGKKGDPVGGGNMPGRWCPL